MSSVSSVAELVRLESSGEEVEIELGRRGRGSKGAEPLLIAARMQLEHLSAGRRTAPTMVLCLQPYVL